MTEPSVQAERHGTWTSLGLELAWREWGDPEAPPVICLHGFLDQGGSFRRVAASLADRWRIIAPDHRGYGRSGHIGPGGYYHFPDYVLDLDALYEHLGLEQAAIVGHSMGAAVAVYFTGSWPERVSALALIDGIGPPHSTDSEGPPRIKRWASDVRKRSGRPPRILPDLAAAVASLKRTSPFAADDVLAEIASDATVAIPGGGLQWRHDGLHRTRAPTPFDADRFACFLEAIRCPVQLTWGHKSPFRAPWNTERAALLTGSPAVTSIEIEGTSHNIHHERPLVLAEHLRSLLMGAEVTD